MALIYSNNFLSCVAEDKLCTAFGIKLSTTPAIVHQAHRALFDTLFVELEHSTLSLADASIICTTALSTGITPFVRVPYQCGDGFVQRVLDGGAMGVIFPHIHNEADAAAAVRISKYPPMGTRSLTGQLPHFGFTTPPPQQVISQANAMGSVVVLMIETQSALQNIDAIASVPGVDVLLVGSNDLSIELGIPGQFETETFRNALRTVAASCKKHGRVMGLAGIYDRRDITEWAVVELGVGYFLAQQDSGILGKGIEGCRKGLVGLDELKGRQLN